MRPRSDIDGDFGIVTGLQAFPDFLLEVFSGQWTGIRIRLGAGFLADGIGVLVRKAEEAAIGGDHQGVGPPESLSDRDLGTLGQ
jgi:hypothetical protein